MCGVIGLVYEHNRDDLGQVAAELLKTLEYRGYDSTGGAFQGDGEDVRLLKGVGAPSVMVRELGITRERGRAFCGQVRWATFGAVTDENSQPHVVRCRAFLYGAHNGNITNCDDLKTWLVSEGHDVKSDNDGEMLVHTVEHFFAREMGEATSDDPALRRRAMRRALTAAAGKVTGSFAAVIVDPVTRVMWAVKQGSSLYFGLGEGRHGGRFAIASSDLSSILKLTRVLVPMTEGEFVEYEPGGHQLYSIEDRTVSTPRGAMRYGAGQPIAREAVRSGLRATDTALIPPFTTFMEQEIAAEEQTVRDVITLFLGGSDAARAVRLPADFTGSAARAALDALCDEYDRERIHDRFRALVDRPDVRAWLAEAPETVTRAPRLHSREAGFFADLLTMAPDAADRAAVHLFDAMLEAAEVHEYRRIVDRFSTMCADTVRRRGRIHAICCGSSYHAAKAASLFFNELAGVELTPMLPGEFRGEAAHSLADGDLVIAVSQSGETKDLIDVLDDVIASGRDIGRISLVNNVNSTIAEEKSHLVIPLGCGPEIAVPATKSFMNQMVVLYCLALDLAGRLAAGAATPDEREAHAGRLAARREQLRQLPTLIRETLERTSADVEVAASLLHLRPSLHLLGTRLPAIAKEGALKIREVVLNHAEGFEASEFKHGPNTILGVNTVIGLDQVEALLVRVGRGLEPDLGALLRADYPLIYITGPDERDVALTVSQINTHKIRGARTVVIAEAHPALLGAATKAPIDNAAYRSVFVTLPRTGDTLMTMFSAIVALQRLALRMSLLKRAHLDRLGIKDHGVDPDAPKNVSKAITVD
jgi:glucosamine 6-phosphate synthetase-like amidotransferase/phosphosugar isomerase protein